MLINLQESYQSIWAGNMEYIGRIENDELLYKYENIVICGCGKIGKKVYECLENMNLDTRIMCFCDSDTKLAGTNYKGVMVVSYADAVNIYSDAVFLIANMDVRKIANKLADNGIHNIHVVR